MRHARDEDLDRIEPLLAAIRALAVETGALREKKRGCFYLKSRSFLHFHEDPKGMFADVGVESFERIQVDHPAGAEALIQRVKALPAPAEKVLR
ncbi:MAG: hypothetical protein ACHP7N_08390 [Caulobacterales bacterium]